MHRRARKQHDYMTGHLSLWLDKKSRRQTWKLCTFHAVICSFFILLSSSSFFFSAGSSSLTRSSELMKSSAVKFSFSAWRNLHHISSASRSQGQSWHTLFWRQATITSILRCFSSKNWAYQFSCFSTSSWVRPGICRAAADMKLLFPWYRIRI